jgi:HEAT repeat protein
VDAIELVPELGDENPDHRERAAAALIDLGDSVIPVMRLALRDRDPEVVRQARDILEALEKRKDPAVIRAAIRQTVHYRLRGSVAALLALVPDASPDELRNIEAALFALREADGQLEPTLVRALDEPDPKIRAVAEAIHGKDRESLAKRSGRRVFPEGIRLPARVSARVGDDVADFEFVDVQFFNAWVVTFLHDP